MIGGWSEEICEDHEEHFRGWKVCGEVVSGVVWAGEGEGGDSGKNGKKSVLKYFLLYSRTYIMLWDER